MNNSFGIFFCGVIFILSVRTDLAIEAREILNKDEQTGAPEGIEASEGGDSEVRITRVKITSENGEKTLGKKQGIYVTIEAPALAEGNPSVSEKASQFLKDELSAILGDTSDKTTLVVGLGNREITPDSLGPRVLSYLLVTRHILAGVPSEFSNNLSPLCAIAPGVLGITGIETAEIIKGVASHVKPDIIIAIDALASLKTERVCTTVQITDTGISPGSGIGNRQNAIDTETLGIPVIAIGVPMVVDAATIANDAIDKVVDALLSDCKKDEDFYYILKNMDREEKYTLIRNVLSDKPLFVTPKEIDLAAERVSKVVASGINMAVHKNISSEDISALTS